MKKVILYLTAFIWGMMGCTMYKVTIEAEGSQPHLVIATLICFAVATLVAVITFKD